MNDLAIKPKILIYSTFLIAGGLEKSLIEYVKIFKKNNYDIELLIDYDLEEKNVFEKLVPEDVKIIYVKSVTVSKLIYKIRHSGKKNKICEILLYLSIVISDFLYYYLKVKPLIKKRKYTTIISFFQYLPSYLTEFKHINHIIFLHGSVEHYFEGIRKYFKKFYFKKIKKYNKIVTVCEEMKNQLIGVFPMLQKENIVPIYTPLDFEEIRAKANEESSLTEEERKMIKEPYIIAVNRIDKGKDIATLIQAYEKVVITKKTDVKLYIVGVGPDRDRLEKMVKEKKLDYMIKFIGAKLNPYIWMKNSKMLILSSKSEGFGLVILEGLILNIPVISSDCKVGPREILNNGEYGDLFEVGDVSRLFEIIIKNLENKREIDYEKALERFEAEVNFEKIKKIIK